MARKNSLNKKKRWFDRTSIYAYEYYFIYFNSSFRNLPTEQNNREVVIDISHLRKILHTLPTISNHINRYYWIGNHRTCYDFNLLAFCPHKNYVSFTDLCKYNYDILFNIICRSEGIFVYKKKLYYTDNGSIYTYPDFNPIVQVIHKNTYNIPAAIIVYKKTADTFIKGLAHKIKAGVDRYSLREGLPKPISIQLDTMPYKNNNIDINIYRPNIFDSVIYTIDINGIATPTLLKYENYIMDKNYGKPRISE